MDDSKKKLIKKFVPLVIFGMAVILCVCILFNDSFTWFSKGVYVETNKLRVAVIKPGCLVISKIESDIRSFGFMNYEVTFDNTNLYTLDPATRRTSDNKLVTYDYSDVDITTGSLKAGATPIDAKENINYKMYTFYVGVVEHHMTFDHLWVKFDDFDTKAIHNALSVDVYVNNVYKGTLNYKNRNTGVDLGINKLEVNGATCKVTYYVYFDGALKGDDNKIIYRAETSDGTMVYVSLKIEAENASDGYYVD